MRKGISIAIAVIFVAGAVGIFWRTPKSDGNAAGQLPGPTSAGSESTVLQPSTKTYTLADVAKHTNGTSCWTAINAKVYDVTSWIDQHPGGAQAILSLCGKDGSAAFNTQHGGQARPAQELTSFYISDLK